MRKLLWLLAFFMGCSGELYIDETPDSDLKGYPLNLSWGDIDTDGDGVRENYITPIKYQPCGDCFIYAAVGLLEIQYQIDHKIQLGLNLSEQNIHNCLRTSCSANGDDRPILDYLRDYGVMTESYVSTGFWGTCNNCYPFLLDGGTTITTVEHVPFFRLGSWYTVADHHAYDRETVRRKIVVARQKGPVSIHINGWKGLRRDGNIVYCAEENPSGHVVVVVGYRFHGKVLLVKNSHGEGGLFQLVYDDGGEDKCGIAALVNQITPGSTYSSWGSGEKFCYSTSDIDKDGIPDVHDNCPWTINPKQENMDKDMFGDDCDECPKDFNPTTGYYCAPAKVNSVYVIIPPTNLLKDHKIKVKKFE